MDPRVRRDGLEPRLGLVSVTSIVVANMIGAGIFTSSGLLMGQLGDPRVMLALWGVGGVIALCGALCYGELGAAIPHAGGEYVFLARIFHPALGFLSGWLSFFAGFSAPIAASAIGFSEYLARAFPAAVSPGLLDPQLEAVVTRKAWAVLVILVFTLVHMRGLSFGARVQNVLTGLKVGLIVGVVGVGFAAGNGSLSHLAQGEPMPLDFASLKTAALALMWVMFAYSGWNAAAYIGSEIRDPGRTLPRSLLLGTGVVAALYLALNLLYLYAIPPDEMAGVIPVAGLAVGNLLGRAWETGLSLLVAFALFSSLSAFIILGPRVYYAMARDRCFFPFAGRVHPRHAVPTGSIVLQGAVASVMVLLGTFDQILTFMGFALGIFPLVAVVGLVVIRRRGWGTYRMPLYPVVPLFFVAANLSILTLAFLERPVESSVAILTVLVGLPAYVAFRARPRRDV